MCGKPDMLEKKNISGKPRGEHPVKNQCFMTDDFVPPDVRGLTLTLIKALKRLSLVMRSL